MFEALTSATVKCLACPSPAETGWRVDSFGQVYGLCRQCSSKLAVAGTAARHTSSGHENGLRFRSTDERRQAIS